MRIGIASDHHGVEIKQNLINFLGNIGYNVVDYGTNGSDMVDYPDYAFKIGEEVANKNIDFGILLCNTGIGMSIACNKVKGARCAKVSNIYEAEMARRDNDANVIALSTRMDIEEMKRIVDKFLNSEYANIDRYNRRVGKINNYND